MDVFANTATAESSDRDKIMKLSEVNSCIDVGTIIAAMLWPRRRRAMWEWFTIWQNVALSGA